MLGNFGARGRQEHGRELCADFFMAFCPRSIFTCSVTVCGVFVLPEQKLFFGRPAWDPFWGIKPPPPALGEFPEEEGIR